MKGSSPLSIMYDMACSTAGPTGICDVATRSANTSQSRVNSWSGTAQNRVRGGSSNSVGSNSASPSTARLAILPASTGASTYQVSNSSYISQKGLNVTGGESQFWTSTSTVGTVVVVWRGVVVTGSAVVVATTADEEHADSASRAATKSRLIGVIIRLCRQLPSPS